MKNTEVVCNKDRIKAIKSLLKLYRKVLHSVNNHLAYLDGETYASSRKHLSDIVNGLIIFENQAAEDKFYDSVCSYHEELELLKLLEKAVVMVKDYPENGRTYYEILDRLYFDYFSYNNEEVMEVLEISRSTYFRYLKKAYECFYTHLIGILRYENKPFNENLLAENFDEFH